VYLSREEVLKFQDRFGDVSKVEESLVVSNLEEFGE
jgi:transcription elongation factor GreA-like protein